jgi:hypothetical protein
MEAKKKSKFIFLFKKKLNPDLRAILVTIAFTVGGKLKEAKKV